MPKYTDAAIEAVVQTAHSDDATWLAPGQHAYLTLEPDEQRHINDLIRQLSNNIPKVGPVNALEILAAVGAKIAKLEPET